MIISLKNYRTADLGSKARNLFRLQEAGFPVPKLICVDSFFCEEEVYGCLAADFPDTAYFSVRSCAALEDSERFSFAGQFRTFLRVPREEVCRRIREVLDHGRRPENKTYLQAHGLHPGDFRMQVIVQEMVEPECSGVLFTANPQGILNESVIVCGRGSGDQIVEDRADATTYYYNLFDKNGYYEQTGTSPLLTKEEVEKLITASRQIRELLSPKSPGEETQEYDIEFAIRNREIYFLQARPITSIEKEAPVIILDNSNIVESYPGITLPLTQSFIRDAYHQVFKSLLLHLTGEEETVARLDENLQHMVDVANGRVYYRISNWYDVLLLLPFSNRLIPVWQEMMGVRDKAVSSELPGKIRRSTRWKVAWSFLRYLWTCPREMDKLDLYFQEIIRQYETLDVTAKENRVLLEHYHSLKDMTVSRWDITLVNDMYGFLFTGLLKSCLKAKHVPDYELAANRAISGVKKLESMRPVELLQKLALQAGEENRLEELRSIRSNEAYYQYIEHSGDAFSWALQDYLRDFGDRNVEELKLESKTFRTDPVLLVRCILQYAECLSDRNDGGAGETKSGKDCTAGTESDGECPGGAVTDKEAGSGSFSDREASAPRLTGLAAFFARRAAVGIRNREKSRLHRGRLYGMMRSLALQMGQNLYRQGRIAEPEDVFWLSCGELEAAESNPALDLAGIVAGRKREYDGYAELPSYARLVFSGKIVEKHPQKTDRLCYDRAEGVYNGTPCSPGIAEGEVLLVDKPSPLLDTKGKILVTKMTDPGWVFLIVPAKAIVSEKGSLLSHTAILSRELKKPAVLGIEHITEYLKTGDFLRVDGDTGAITVLTDEVKG